MSGTAAAAAAHGEQTQHMFRDAARQQVRCNIAAPSKGERTRFVVIMIREGVSQQPSKRGRPASRKGKASADKAEEEIVVPAPSLSDFKKVMSIVNEKRNDLPMLLTSEADVENCPNFAHWKKRQRTTDPTCADAGMQAPTTNGATGTDTT